MGAMNRNYDFPTSAERMLRSYRKHVVDLINTTTFLDSSYGFERIAHFTMLDDLLSYVYYLENGRWLGERDTDDLPARPYELGPFKLPSVLEDIKNNKLVHVTPRRTKRK